MKEAKPSGSLREARTSQMPGPGAGGPGTGGPGWGMSFALEQNQRGFLVPQRPLLRLWHLLFSTSGATRDFEQR